MSIDISSTTACIVTAITILTTEYWRRISYRRLLPATWSDTEA